MVFFVIQYWDFPGHLELGFLSQLELELGFSYVNLN